MRLPLTRLCISHSWDTMGMSSCSALLTMLLGHVTSATTRSRSNAEPERIQQVILHKVYELLPRALLGFGVGLIR